MDKKLDKEISRRHTTLENLEESIKERQLVLDDLQADAEAKNSKIEIIKKNSREMDLENVDIEYKRKKLDRELCALTEMCLNLRRENERLAGDVEDLQHEGTKLEAQKRNYKDQIDHSEGLQCEVGSLLILVDQGV